MAWTIIKITMQTWAIKPYYQDWFYHPNLVQRQQYRRPCGTCYQCGKMGHIQVECPSQPDKYPFCNKGVSGSLNIMIMPVLVIMGVDNVCVESRGQSEVAIHSGEVFNAISEYDSDVNAL